MTLTRRRFVKLLGGAAALATLPLPGCGDNIQLRGTFLDAHQWRTLDVASDYVCPGARQTMAVRYIDQLLAAFERGPLAPAIFGGGPFSGRTQAPDGTQPEDDFAQFIPLTRVQEIAWRTRIYGSAQTPGGDFNDTLLGATVGWRDQYVQAIEQLDQQVAGKAFVDLGTEDQQTALYTVASALPDWWNAFVEHVLEGMFGAPEYGGNANLAGWELASYDGDSAPLGHAQYDPNVGDYVDRADQPTSTASPGATSEDYDQDVIDVLTVAAIGSGGMKFF